MELHPFQAGHFQDYADWFEHRAIESALGHIDEEWLHHILSNPEGIEFAALQEGRLVAVVGVTYPNTNHPYWVITNLAVVPERFRQGIGTLVLDGLFQKISLQAGEYWVTYVHFTNFSALNFLKKNGWKAVPGEAEGMIRFEYHSTGR